MKLASPELGIDAQRAAVSRFAKAEGFEVAAEFTEVETGKGTDALDRRPGWRSPQRKGVPDRRRQARPALARRAFHFPA